MAPEVPDEADVHGSKSNTPNRRRVLAAAGAAAGAVCMPAILQAGGAELRIHVVGGGISGVSCARMLKDALGARAAITVVSPDLGGYTPPFTRTAEFLGAGRTTIDAAAPLGADGIDTRPTQLETFDPAGRGLTFADGTTARSDIVVLAPGIVPVGGPTSAAHDRMLPALWDSTGPDIRTGWLDDIKDGEQIVVLSPPQPYRCPPAVYERVCLLGEELGRRQVRARLLILDAKDRYPMQSLFETAYADYLEDMVEWIPPDFHGGIEAIDLDAREIVTGFDTVKADWLHAVPAQQAPAFMIEAGLCDDDGYGLVDARTMASPGHQGVYILGDAASAHEMSKSADSSLVHARIAANAILRDIDPALADDPGEIEDRCWTFLAENDAVSLYGRYRATADGFEAVERAVSDIEDSAGIRADNAETARAWSESMIGAVFGG